MDDASTIFERERPRLLSVAYALLGSYSEAEDAVQEAWVRYLSMAAEVLTPEAWLTTVVSRIALDQLRSARVQRESYTGVWLPEPVSTLPNPEDTEAVRSRLALGFLFLLEQLKPEERAAIVLREAFDRSFEEIAATLGKSVEACRQLISRAKRRLGDRPATDASVPQSIVNKCVDALRRIDETELLSLLADNVVLYGDGGGRVPSVLNPIYGAEKILRFFAGLRKRYAEDFRFEPVSVNGEPAILAEIESRRSVIALSVVDGRVAAFYLVSNPDKITAFTDVSLSRSA